MCGSIKVKTPAGSDLFILRFSQLEGANFEFLGFIFDSLNVAEGALFICTTKNSVYHLEGVDLYINGEIVQFHQKDGKNPVFKFGKF